MPTARNRASSATGTATTISSNMLMTDYHVETGVTAVDGLTKHFENPTYYTPRPQ